MLYELKENAVMTLSKEKKEFEQNKGATPNQYK